MHKPPGLGLEVVLSIVAVAPFPLNVHVGQTRLLEPGVGKVAVFREENWVMLKQTSAGLQAPLDVLPVEDVVWPEGQAVQLTAELEAEV